MDGEINVRAPGHPPDAMDWLINSKASSLVPITFAGEIEEEPEGKEKDPFVLDSICPKRL